MQTNIKPVSKMSMKEKEAYCEELHKKEMMGQKITPSEQHRWDKIIADLTKK